MSGTSETRPRVADAVALLRRQAQARPEAQAVDFAPGWERLEDALSYAELDRRARTIAGDLLSKLQPGARVILAEPPGVGFVSAFFGCLYAGMIAVPVALPRRSGTDEAQRFAHVARDCDAAAILAPRDIADRLVQLSELSALTGLLWLDRETCSDELEAPLAVDPEQVAFLQYTSGSTGAPRGVMVRHRNIVHNAHRIMVRCRLDEHSRALIWLPHFHDLGLIGGIVVPLYTGFPTTLMSPLQFAKRPLEWLRLIGRGGYTISGGPNFAFRLCVERFDREKMEGVDLSSWRCAFNCAEPIEASTVKAFAETFAPWGFRSDAVYPCYGMAETTLTIASNAGRREVVVFGADADRLEATGAAAPAAPGARRRELVSVGQAAGDQVIVVVDPVSLSELPEGQVGEVCTTDESVTAGYWRRPEQTAAMLLTLPRWPQLEFLRTGDLGFLLSGELFITGRLKDLIIVDGRNLHPEDLEATIRSAAGVSAALGVVAFSNPGANGREGIVVVLELERTRTVSPDGLRSDAQKALFRRHEVSAADIVLVPAGTIPRTTSGKVRRREASAAYRAGAFHSAESRRSSARVR